MQANRVLTVFLLGLASLALLSCVTAGRDFPAEHVSAIKIGETTKGDVFRLFGQPWRRGIEDGLTTWTYGSYRYRAFGSRDSSDLVVRFDKNGVVSSFAYSTTEKDDNP